MKRQLWVLFAFVLIGAALSGPSRAATAWAVKDSAGTAVAKIDDVGNLTVGGDVYQGMSAIAAGSGDFIGKNGSGTVVMRIKTSATANPPDGSPPKGALQLTGTIHEHDTAALGETIILNIEARDPGSGSIRRVAAVGSTGNLYLLGAYTVDPSMAGGGIVSHRIGTRIAEGGPELYDTSTSQEFNPDGFVYMHEFAAHNLNDGGAYIPNALYHRQFAPEVYTSDTQLGVIDDMFQKMHDYHYNIVRVINDVDTLSGTFASQANFKQSVIDNTADFIKKARRQEIMSI